ncbi:MAG: hypothetical protein HWN65_20310 [Candidatus Helarchaeota archaeon]|nr:hypothetical protein [Candidatus Helarchaeota archaeon]
MKTGAEVIGEMILAGLRSKPKEEREELMEDLYGIKAQITLPNLHEALMLHFEEVDGKKWVRYESLPTPVVKCKACGWEGTWADLPTREEDIILPKRPEGEELILKPTKTIVIEECAKCKSKKLKMKNFKHEEAKIVIYGSHWDIGVLGDAIIGPIGHRIKGIFKALWKLITRKVRMSPFYRIRLALKVGGLLM